MKKEQMEGRFRSWRYLAGSRKTTELAAFRVKSCLHPLCCKIRFPLFSEGQRPWKHLWLPRGCQLLLCWSGQHLSAPKWSQGWREMISACKKKKRLPGAESLSAFILKSHERQEGLSESKTFRPQAKASWISPWAAPKNDQQIGEMSEAALGREKGWGAQFQASSGRRALPRVFPCRSDAQGGLWIACFWQPGDSCAVLNPSCWTASTTNQLHAGFSALNPLGLHPSRWNYGCSSNFSPCFCLSWLLSAISPYRPSLGRAMQSTFSNPKLSIN